MSRIKFEHEWKSPFSISETWALFCGALIDSEESVIWPSSLSHVQLLSPELGKDSIISIEYKMGPVQHETAYTLHEFESPHLLGFKTTANHPLIGASKISLEQTAFGVNVRWTGTYESKGDLKSLAILAWFKIFYENLFFPMMKRAFKPSKPRDIGTYQDLSHSMH
jgi:hypothetical protein